MLDAFGGEGGGKGRERGETERVRGSSHMQYFINETTEPTIIQDCAKAA